MTAGTWDDTRLRVYLEPGSIGSDGYPHAWHSCGWQHRIDCDLDEDCTCRPRGDGTGVKHLIRELNGYRCERCHHPFTPGSPGEWSPCDGRCTHHGPTRMLTTEGWEPLVGITPGLVISTKGFVGAPIEAQWRILTVHHLNGVKHDLRWWNLAALCQRCHLEIQGKVRMERSYLGTHTDWFKPHAAGWYAWSFRGLELGRDETIARLEELLDLEHRQENLW